MSYAYASHRFGYTWTLDSDEVNDNLVVFASEVNGNLNEQNFAYASVEDMISNERTKFDLMARPFVEKVRVNPFGSTSAMEAVPQVTRWVPIAASTKQFTSRGGLAWVIIRFQLRCPASPTAASGLNFAIEIDGVVRSDTLLGTGDQSNDFLDTAFGSTVSGGQVEWDFGSSPSFKAEHEPKLVKGLFRVEPGVHTVRLAARNLFTVDDTLTQFISQIETIVIDLWA